MDGRRRRSDDRLERSCFFCGGAVLVVCLVTGGPALGIEPSAPAMPMPAAADPGEVDRWHQNLVRERQVEVRLRNALREIESGHVVVGLTGVQSILDRDDDVFIRSPTEPVPRGAHALAGCLLGSLAASSLATYETLFGPEARKLLETSRSRPDADLLARIVRRFYHTAAGFEAGNRLAAWWTDHGCDELAWGWWQRVLREPVHERRVSAVHRVEAALCCRRLGQVDAARALLEDIDGAQSVAIGGQPATIAHWREKLSAGEPRRLADDDSPGIVRNNNRDGSTSGSPPALTRPLWRGTLAGDQSRHIESLARTWESYQVQNGLPVGTGQFPLLVGRRLIYRDFEGLRAVDVETGRPEWFYPCASSLSREILPRQIVATDGNPDSNNVMRYVVGNCLLGTLASDGRHVFAVDGIEADDSPPAAVPPATGEAAATPPRLHNLLLAFDISPAMREIEPKWTIGGRVTESGPARPLAGHYFLGPPLTVDDRLFAVSESNQQLHLSCLMTQTGALVWSQILCSVPQSIGSDHQRFALVCTPAYRDGIVISPTQAGVLVAVDAVSGTLLWAASHDDGEPLQRQQIAAWPHTSRRRYAHAGYVNLPVIHGTNVVYLPAHSEHVHCLDLTTGRLRWRVRRDDLEPTTATEYVAAVHDDTVVVVGRRKCRGLRLANGAQKWSVPLRSTPTGRGALLGSTYCVPLDDGRIVNLDIKSGRQHAAPATGGERLGNLLAGRDLVVSLGTNEISVYPQAHKALQGLDAELRQGRRLPARLIEVARLELLLGRFDEAEKRLEEVLKSSVDPSQARQAVELLSDLFTRNLSDGDMPTAQSQSAALARLGDLAAAPGEKGRFLLHQCRYGRECGDAQSLLDAARELATMNVEASLAAPGDPSRSAAPCVLAADLLKGLARTDRSLASRLEAQIASQVAAALASRDGAALRRMIRLDDDTPAADEARLELAQLLYSNGQLQQAEMALLACRESRSASGAGRATRRLVELWDAQGLHHDAALLIGELAARFADVEVAPQQSGSAWSASLARESPLWEAYRRLTPPLWSASGVSIIENRITDDALQAVYNGNGIQSLGTPRQSPFELFDRGRGAAAVFNVVDRHTGREYPETINVPGRFSYPFSAHQEYVHHSHVGHFFPLGGTGALHGISLLERKVLWTTIPPRLAGVKDVVRVGPAGANFCTFQYRQHLCVVDPIDGRVLWHRDDLEPAAGLMSEPFLGIIGDDKVLAVFGSNGANYAVYDTASGSELRRGKLDVQTRLGRRAIGRRLLHNSGIGETRRLRVWDALTDDFVWDEPAETIAEASVHEGVPPGTKVFAFVRETDEAAYLTTAGQIRVVDLVSGRQRFELAVEPGWLEDVSFLRAFCDDERYYFNLERSGPPAKSPQSPYHLITDASLPCVHVKGELCAFDIKKGRMLWKQTLPNRSLLQMPDLTLPVLVAISRVRKDDQSTLSVEVLDVLTGDIVGERKDLFSDRLLKASYDRSGGRIELRGAKTSIRLEFPATVARLNAGEPRP
jgi:outer membrane protein assembly factor BamB